MESSEQKQFKVLITYPDVHPIVDQILGSSCELIRCTQRPAKRAEILEKVKGMDAILWISQERLDDEVLEAAGGQLKVVSTMTNAIDCVDLPALRKRNILLGHTPRAADTAVAELAIGLMLAAARRICEGRRKIETSSWENNNLTWMFGHTITNATVGFYGFGRVGQAIAKRLSGFDIYQILYTTRRRLEIEVETTLKARKVPFDELCEESDIIFVAATLSEETEGAFDEAAFMKMKRNAVLVNIANGKIVNQTALIAALKAQRIFAAGIDVMEIEPVPASDPLLALPNLVITPHIGSAIEETRQDMAAMAAHNILKGLKGQTMPAPA